MVIGGRVAAGGVVLAMLLAGSAMWVSLSAIAVLGAVTMILDRLGSAVVRARRWHRPAREWSRGRLWSRGAATGTTLVAPLTGRPASEDETNTEETS